MCRRAGVRLVLEAVEAGTRDGAVLQGGDQRVLVDGGTARDVDDMTGGTERLQHFGIDHVAIGFVGAVREDERVRPFREVEHGLEVRIRNVLFAAVVIADFGLEGGEAVRDLEADRTEADDASAGSSMLASRMTAAPSTVCTGSSALARSALAKDR